MPVTEMSGPQLAVSGSFSVERLRHWDRSKRLHAAIAGPISAGKSTLLNAFLPTLRNERPDLADVVAVSQEDRDSELLTLYISDAKWSLVFQTVKIEGTERRRANLEKKVKYRHKTITIIEREIEENRVFALANTVFGNMTREDYDVWYCTHFEKLEARTKQMPSPHIWFFLYTRQDVANKRMNSRAVDSENEYENDYLSALYDTYFHWVLRMLASGQRIHVLDWNRFGHASEVLGLMADCQQGQLTTATAEYDYTDVDFLDKPAPNYLLVEAAGGSQEAWPFAQISERRTAQYHVFSLLSKQTSVKVSYAEGKPF